MNVLLVTPSDQAFGGVAAVVGHLGRQLQQRGHRVVFFFLGPEDVPRRGPTTQGFAGYAQNLRAPFLPVTPMRSPIAFMVLLMRTLYRLGAVMRAEQIDIVNIHYPVDRLVYFAFLRLLMRFKLVVSVHGTDLFPIGQRQVGPGWTVRLLLRWADAVVAPSRSYLQDCMSRFPEVARRGLAIHNGVDFDELAPATSPVTNGDPYILCIAAHNEKKALDVLLRAFVAIHRARPGVRLLLVGDGPLRPELEQLARDLSLSSTVEFLGERGRAEIGPLLQGCSVFVLPSRAEPFGMVLVEALALRRPVVATTAGGIPEIVEHGTSGILVEPDHPDALAAAILRVLGDAALSAAIAGAGEARAKQLFGSAAMGSRYERLFQDLLADPPSFASGPGGPDR